MTQLSSTASTCATQWKMRLIKVFSVIYLTAVCAAQTEDPEDATAVYGDITPTNAVPMSTVAPTVYVPPVPSVTRQSDWSDVFPSEKVELSCSIAGSSDWTLSWLRNNQDVQTSDPRVSFSADKSVLTVTAEAQASPESYSCQGRHKTRGVTTQANNALTLTVYASVPKPTVKQSPNSDEMFPRESITFTCAVGESSGWKYEWYHNGSEIQAANGNTYTINSISHSNSGQYHCRAKRGTGPFYTSHSDKTTLQVSDPPQPSVKLLSTWDDMFKGESVDLKCEVDSFDWTFSWYRDKAKLPEDMWDPEEPYLNISSITRAHQGGYSCRVHHRSRNVNSEFSNTVDIKVYGDVPKATMIKNSSLNAMYRGETVSFTCSVAVSSGWEYEWLKDGKPLTETSKTISIHLGPSDGGKYACMASRGEKTSTQVSEEIRQDVLEIPVPSSKRVTLWSDVFPEERVEFSCEMSNSSDWMYTWYKDGQTVQPGDAVSFDSKGANLTVRSASPAHAGQYKCSGYLKDRSVSSTSSAALLLTVYDKKPSLILTQDPDYNLMFPGESVSFSCHINVSSGWKYQWFKDDNLLGSSEKTYTINPIETTSRGSYKCQVQRGTTTLLTYSSQVIRLQVNENKPRPSLTQRPDVDKLYTGESLSFICEVKLSSGWEYIWHKGVEELRVHSSILNITDAKLSNSGNYKCIAKRSKTMYKTEYSDERSLSISEIPVPSLKLMTPWSDIFPGESVNLSCAMNGSSDWKYTWRKDGEEVQAGSNNAVTFHLDAMILNISSASPVNHGEYRCSAKLKTRSVTSIFSHGLTLSVYDTKPRATLLQNPSHDVMHSGDSVTLSCHINVSTGWDYLWYKDGSQMAESEDSHHIASVLTKNSGEYKCKTKRGKTATFFSDESQVVSLNIKERPKASITLLTGWSEVFSTDSLMLSCEVKDGEHSWNYTWFKGDERIDQPPSRIHTVTPQENPDQGLYFCRGNRTGLPSYSKTSDEFKTKNLLLKRRVLLAISGFIFFAIIAIFLGCIILRVTRKKAADEYKPEEAELFTRMDQIKDRDDTPCPVVQYITDAALNAPPKEGEENGTICSETTPLPITSQEDQAVTTESPDETENNGGLVSFKQ